MAAVRNANLCPFGLTIEYIGWKNTRGVLGRQPVSTGKDAGTPVTGGARRREFCISMAAEF
jgi:hypothetical protein